MIAAHERIMNFLLDEKISPSLSLREAHLERGISLVCVGACVFQRSWFMRGFGWGASVQCVALAALNWSVCELLTEQVALKRPLLVVKLHWCPKVSGRDAQADLKDKFGKTITNQVKHGSFCVITDKSLHYEPGMVNIR